MFLSSYRNTSGSLGEQEMLLEHGLPTWEMGEGLLEKGGLLKEWKPV